jgi:hypothetical protein
MTLSTRLRRLEQVQHTRTPAPDDAAAAEHLCQHLTTEELREVCALTKSATTLPDEWRDDPGRLAFLITEGRARAAACMLSLEECKRESWRRHEAEWPERLARSWERMVERYQRQREKYPD